MSASDPQREEFYNPNNSTIWNAAGDKLTAYTTKRLAWARKLAKTVTDLRIQNLARARSCPANKNGAFR